MGVEKKEWILGYGVDWNLGNHTFFWEMMRAMIRVMMRDGGSKTNKNEHGKVVDSAKEFPPGGCPCHVDCWFYGGIHLQFPCGL